MCVGHVEGKARDAESLCRSHGRGTGKMEIGHVGLNGAGGVENALPPALPQNSGEKQSY